MIQRIACVFAAILTVATSAHAEPLTPTGKWEVQYTASTCTAKRAYGDYLLVFEPSPLGRTIRYVVQGPGKATRARQYNTTIDLFDGGAPIKTTSLLFPLRIKGSRAMQTVLPIPDAERIEKASRMRISTGGTGIKQTEKIPYQPESMTVELALGSMTALSKTVTDCMNDLQKFWGMVDGKLPVPATKAKGSLQGIFTSDDYPEDALLASHVGSTTYLLLIDERGAILDCVVTGTSGVASLDAMGCQVIRERARFTPARDGEGKPVKDAYSASVGWQIRD